jgi:hypothetical protein
VKFSTHGITKTVGALALAGGMLVATALPAAAASPNRAYGASAFGPITRGPIGQATFPGISPVFRSNANIPPLLSTGTVIDRAGPTSASSLVRKVRAFLGHLATLKAKSVQSACSFNTNTGRVRGFTKIFRGKISKVKPVFLPTFPAPNTTIWLPTLGKVTLNRQRTAPDGTLTVQAVYISFLRSRQTVSIGVSVCNAADLAPVPILPTRSAQITLGGVVVLLLAGLGYQVSRRRRAATA